MKFYFAGSFNRIDEIRACRQQLIGAGHTCTSRWLNGHHQVSTDDLGPDSVARQFALEDIFDIRQAAAVVKWSSHDQNKKGRGGRHVEFGVAWAWNKPIFLIGERENAFHSLVPDVCKFYGFRDFLIALDVGLIEDLIAEQQLNPRVFATSEAELKLQLERK